MDIRTTTKGKGEEHWTKSGGKDLFLWSKRAIGARQGTVLFIHGSSMPTQPTFDLQVDGMPEASVMDWFATRGFDAWTFDCRGYGRSYKGKEMLATIAEGAEDAAAASEYIMARGSGPLLVYGISSGSLRAGLFAQRHPERVARLALEALVWTGEGSPTLEQRRKKLDEWRATTRRPIDRPFMMTMFTRDHASTIEERFIDPLVNQVLALDDSSPNGTYIDMCANLPVIDPEKITVPTLIMRGQYDGIAALDDLMAFFKKLPSPDKALTVMPAVSHGSFRQKNFLASYQILHAFFSRPALAFRE
ncbi:MAG: alpha/beta fold hydrolase [Alphaproteobacteria bacterium]|nr:alpha/beta fold hydrolase [Alphaproteobacteria bacterium]